MSKNRTETVHRKALYPYQTRFIKYMEENLEYTPETIDTYDRTLSTFFNYLESNLDDFGIDDLNNLNNITVNEINRFIEFTAAQDGLNLKPTTTNKYICALKRYFLLMLHLSLIYSLPTATIELRKIDNEIKLDIDLSWIKLVDGILQDEDIRLKSRVVFLFLLKQFQLSEMLKEDFPKRVEKIQFSTVENDVLSQYKDQISELQSKHSSSQYFLKQNNRKISDNDLHVVTRNYLAKLFKEVHEIYPSVPHSTSQVIYQVRIMQMIENPSVNKHEWSARFGLTIDTIDLMLDYAEQYQKSKKD